MFPLIKTFVQIFDRKALIVAALSLTTTYLSAQAGIRLDMPLELIGIAIVFPIVFSTGRAFQRRESALVELADFKANLIGLYFAHRDWPDSPRDEHA